MADRPDWIDERLDVNLNNKLTQDHVVDVMLAADRPFFSITQLQSLISPDVDPGTIRNRLDELREIDVVEVEEYPQAISLYYINHPESQWPLSPEGKQSLAGGTPIDNLTLKGFLTLQDSRGIQTLAVASVYIGIILLILGALNISLQIPIRVEAESQAIVAGVIVMTLAPILLGAEQAARWLRGQRWWQPPNIGGVSE